MNRAAVDISDNRITAYGLLLEANRRLERVFEHSLHTQHGMTKITFEALLRLGRSESGRLSMTDLANQMILSSGGITRLIDRLTAAGLVERLQCDEDRRVQWAQLTDQGRAALETALATHLDDLEAHFSSQIAPDELPVLTRVLERIRAECGGEAAATH